MIDVLLWYTGFGLWLAIIIAVIGILAAAANDRRIRRRKLLPWAHNATYMELPCAETRNELR